MVASADKKEYVMSDSRRLVNRVWEKTGVIKRMEAPRLLALIMMCSRVDLPPFDSQPEAALIPRDS
jgi:hypothetical protein